MFLVPRLAWLFYDWILKTAYIGEMFLKRPAIGLGVVLEKPVSRVREVLLSDNSDKLCFSNLQIKCKLTSVFYL